MLSVEKQGLYRRSSHEERGLKSGWHKSRGIENFSRSSHEERGLKYAEVDDDLRQAESLLA